MNGDGIWQSCQNWCWRVRRLRCWDARIISAVFKARSCQKQATCCAFAGLLILQVDSTPCEIGIYYRRIVIPFFVVLCCRRQQWKRARKNREKGKKNGTATVAKDNLFWHYLWSHQSINDAWRFTVQVREIVLPFTTWSAPPSTGPMIFALGTVLCEGNRGEEEASGWKISNVL